MEKEQIVSIPQMRDALKKNVGSNYPLKLTRSNGEVMIRYIRGFADAQANILLISENAYSLALKIVEIKDIRILEFAHENSNGKWQILHAKWLLKVA